MAEQIPGEMASPLDIKSASTILFQDQSDYGANDATVQTNNSWQLHFAFSIFRLLETKGF